MGDTYFPRTVADIEATTGDKYVNTIHSGGSGDIWFNLPTLQTTDISWTIYNGPVTDIEWHIFPAVIASIQGFLLKYIESSYCIRDIIQRQFDLTQNLISSYNVESVLETEISVSFDPDETFEIKDPLQTNFTIRQEIVDTFTVFRVLDGTI